MGDGKVAGCLEMNDFEINFLDTEKRSSSGDARVARDETDTFARGGGREGRCHE